MKPLMLAISCLLIAPPLAAQTPSAQATVDAAGTVSAKRNDVIFTSDGRRLGRVDAVRGGQVYVIHAGRYLPVPVSTLTAEGRRLKTSLGFAEIVGR